MIAMKLSHMKSSSQRYLNIIFITEYFNRIYLCAFSHVQDVGITIKRTKQKRRNFMFTVIQKCLTFLNYKMSTLSDFRRVKINLIPDQQKPTYVTVLRIHWYMSFGEAVCQYLSQYKMYTFFDPSHSTSRNINYRNTHAYAPEKHI